MKLNEFFGLSEGADDAQYRSKATKSFEDVVNMLAGPSAKNSIAGSFKAKNGNFSIVFDLEKLTGDKELHSDLHLAFVLGNTWQGRNGSFLSADESVTKKNRISLFIKPENISVSVDSAEDISFSASDQKDVPLFIETLGEWNTVVIANAVNILDTMKNTYIHEFIHFLDHPRMNGKMSALAKSIGHGGKNPVAYFNSPHELNAFTQEIFSRLESEFSTATSKEKAAQMMGGTPQALARKVEETFHRKMWERLSDENKRKVKKRSYQLWKDVLSKFETTSSKER